MLGNYDCEFAIPGWIQKFRFPSVPAAVKYVIDIYFGIIAKVKRRFPDRTVIVHPVVPREMSVAPIVFEFNKTLQQKCTEKSIEFMDVFPNQLVTPVDRCIAASQKISQDVQFYIEQLVAYLKATP
jgi:hypothetical protein